MITATLGQRVDAAFVALDHGCTLDEVRFEVEKLAADLRTAGLLETEVVYEATDDAPEESDEG